MAFLLRQFQEGDTVFTVQNIGNTPNTDCWVNSNGNYDINKLEVVVNGTAYDLGYYDVIRLSNGFLHFKLPSATQLTSAKDNTSIQVRSKCDNNVSDTKTALPVGFSINTPESIFTCNVRTFLVPTIKERVRLFFTDTNDGNTIAKFTLNDTAFNRPLTFLESGYTNNYDSVDGTWSEVVNGASSIYWSNNLYSPLNILKIEPLSSNYFTARLGYIELIFNGTNITVINYLTAEQVTLNAYDDNDVILLKSTTTDYQVTLNGVTIYSAYKIVEYSTSGGSFFSNRTYLGESNEWILPQEAGFYQITIKFGDVALTKVVEVKSCNNTTTYEMLHKLDGFLVKGCPEGQVEMYRNNIRVATLDTSILGEVFYGTLTDGYYKFRTKCTGGDWSFFSCNQYFSFSNCKPKTTCKELPDCTPKKNCGC